MSAFPTDNRTALVEWCEAQQEYWVRSAGAIGLSAAQAAAFASATSAARKRLLAQEAAQQAARVATQQANDAMQRLRELTGQSVRSIRAFADTAERPDRVYAEARIAPPARRSPAPPPATPTRLAAQLNAATGALTLSWRARNPSGRAAVTYLVQRRLAGETDFGFLGAAGKKTFVDTTLPAGTASVQYIIQPQRGGNVGARSEILTVHFGAAQTRDDNASKRQYLQTSKSQNALGRAQSRKLAFGSATL